MTRKIVVVAFVILAMLVAIPVAYAQPADQVVPAGLTPTIEPPTLTPTPTEECTPTPTVTPTNTPEPTPTPDKWDKSSIKVDGACKEGVPTFNIYNGGSDMKGTSRYWFINGHASAATCAEIAVNPLLGEGDFQLPAGGSVDVFFPEGYQPPYSICVAQREGHPGTGYAAASIESNETCATAEDVVDEPVAGKGWLLFLPSLGVGQ